MNQKLSVVGCDPTFLLAEPHIYILPEHKSVPIQLTTIAKHRHNTLVLIWHGDFKSALHHLWVTSNSATQEDHLYEITAILATIFILYQQTKLYGDIRKELCSQSTAGQLQFISQY